MLSGYVRSLLGAMDLLKAKGITVGWSSEYSSHVADAREMTLNGDNRNDPRESRPFKGSITYDKILWIDSDIIFTPEDVLKAYESEFDVVSGAYTLASGEVVAYKELFGRGYTMDEVKEMTEPERIFGAGFGFLCMKSGIFEKMTRPWFQQVIATTTFEGEDFTFPIMGEDLSLCKRINDLGFEIWLDPSIKLIHHKTFKLTWEGLQL
jgi:GT2 family glycosyltransferase